MTWKKTRMIRCIAAFMNFKSGTHFECKVYYKLPQKEQAVSIKHIIERKRMYRLRLLYFTEKVAIDWYYEEIWNALLSCKNDFLKTTEKLVMRTYLLTNFCLLSINIEMLNEWRKMIFIICNILYKLRLSILICVGFKNIWIQNCCWCCHINTH